MRAIDPALQPEPHRLTGQHLDMARHRVIGLVAMHVDPQAASRGHLAQQPHRLAAVGHRALEVRNAADHVHAEIERPLEQLQGGQPALRIVAARVVAQHALLRKGDQLQIEIGRHPPTHLEHRFDCDHARIRGIDMTTDGEQAAGNRLIAIGERPLDDRLAGQVGLEFAPDRDALKQRPRLVQPRAAQRHGGVHMEMRIDERRRQQQAAGVDLATGCGLRQHRMRLDRRNALALDGNIDTDPPVGQRRIANHQIEHLSALPCGRVSSVTGDRPPAGP